jgi:hypothetical protein
VGGIELGMACSSAEVVLSGNTSWGCEGGEEESLVVAAVASSEELEDGEEDGEEEEW